MKKKLLSKQEEKRIALLSASEMIKESAQWTPSQWAVYMTKGETFDDTELDRFVDEEIIAK